MLPAEAQHRRLHRAFTFSKVFRQEADQKASGGEEGPAGENMSHQVHTIEDCELRSPLITQFQKEGLEVKIFTEEYRYLRYSNR